MTCKKRMISKNLIISCMFSATIFSSESNILSVMLNLMLILTYNPMIKVVLGCFINYMLEWERERNESMPSGTYTTMKIVKLVLGSWPWLPPYFEFASYFLKHTTHVDRIRNNLKHAHSVSWFLFTFFHKHYSIESHNKAKSVILFSSHFFNHRAQRSFNNGGTHRETKHWGRWSLGPVVVTSCSNRIAIQ